jgi:2-C-methyl-D-erythritol 2,4-cyclodiphosphate synthase
MTRTGIGYDVHQLADGEKLIIGGVEIPSPIGSVGHSDGDALIHAVVDALWATVVNFFPVKMKLGKALQVVIFWLIL